MQSFFKVSALVMFFLASTFTASFAQTDWTKYAGNPVLSVGSPGSWDDRNVGTQSVIFDGTTYHMWYAGNLPSTSGGIGYATSPDGINWTKHSGNPVLQPGSPGNWDEATVYEPFVVFDGSVFHMWYTGAADTLLFGPIFIGYATSSNGSAWTKHPGNPVLSPGSPGSWDDKWIDSHCIIYVSGTYHMWYGAWNGTPEQIRIGHATSPDGIIWTRDPNNPVLSFGVFGSWDFPRVEGPNVVYDGATFHMWYSAGDWFAWRIGYATSQDGSAWTKFTGNPVLNWGSAGSWDDITVGFSSVILYTATSTYKMWYSGSDNIWDMQIGYATAPVTINVPGDLPTIQAAIDLASDGSLVLVADGTYLENINFKGKAITVASHFYLDGDSTHIDNTIIDGSNPANPDSGSVVTFGSGEDTTSVLYGFTITGGSGNMGLVDNLMYRAGGGIYCMAGAKIEHNKIINNSVVYSDSAAGAGIFSWQTEDVNLVIKNNEITSGSITATSGWGGGMYINADGQSHVDISNNIVSDNVINADGGSTAGAGIACESDGTPNIFTIVGNTVMNNQCSSSISSLWNYAAGIHIWDAPVTMVDNKIVNNNIVSTSTVGYGAGMRMFSSNGSIIVRNIISMNHIQGNAVCYGGGIYLDNSSPIIQNNLIVKNSATYGGGLRIYSFTEKNQS